MDKTELFNFDRNGNIINETRQIVIKASDLTAELKRLQINLLVYKNIKGTKIVNNVTSNIEGKIEFIKELLK